MTCLLSAVTGCQYDTRPNTVETGSEQVRIEFCYPDYITKSVNQKEVIINDLNLLVFHNGELEHKRWTLVEDGVLEDIHIGLIKGHTYSFYALVNHGKEIDVTSWEELEELKLEIGNDTDGRSGLLMSGAIIGKTITGHENLSIQLIRMEAKISLRIDRSQLSDNVELRVKKVSIGNSAKYINAVGPNTVKTKYDCYAEGDILNEKESSPLNNIIHEGLSYEVDLFLPENMQGEFPEQIGEDEEKVFEEGHELAGISSFIQIEMEYTSNQHYSTEKNLIYRFYLGDSRQNLDVERNCHYHITVIPKGSGLSRSGWRVDKTGIGTYVQQIILSEQNCKFNYKGQQNLLEAEVLPSDATYKDVIWNSSNYKIASVKQDGTITAVGEGECNIICKALDNSGILASCKVEVKFAEPYFTIYPGSFVTGKVGDSVHIWCEFFPPNASFDLGYEELNYDKERGIYDYTVDKDGHGVTLTLKKAGSGILFMSAGDPVNESGIIIVEVNP